MKKEVKLAWGQTLDGSLLHINNTKQGLSCSLLCPSCEGKLIANKGNVKSWHFSHHEKTNCKGESAIHKAAKQIVSKASSIKTPSLQGIVTETCKQGIIHNQKWSIEECLTQLKSAIVEKKITPDIVTDCLCETNDGELAVEIAFKNPKSSRDITKFINRRVNAIEIDVNNIAWDITPEELETLVLFKAPRKWLYCKRSLDKHDQAKKQLNKRLIQSDEENIATLHEYAYALFKEIINKDKLVYTISTSSVEISLSGQRVYNREERELFLTEMEVPETDTKIHGLRAIGKINEQTIVKLYFVSENNSHLVEDNCPHLIISFSSDLHCFGLNHKYSLHSANRWNSKLLSICRENAKRKVDNVNEVQGHIFNNTVGYKLNYLCNLANLNQNLREFPNLYEWPCWNVPAYIWKIIIFYFFIKESTSTIDISKIAKDSFFTSLIKAPTDGDEFKHRVKDISFWLIKETQRNPFVSHLSGTIFEPDRNKIESNIKLVSDVIGEYIN